MHLWKRNAGKNKAEENRQGKRVSEGTVKYGTNVVPYFIRIYYLKVLEDKCCLIHKKA